MATYTPVSPDTPSHERTVLITAVAAGDRIDLYDVLGRAARGLIIEAANATDEVTYRLNNLTKGKRKKVPGKVFLNQVYNTCGVHEQDWEFYERWGSTDVFTTVGAQWQTVDGLEISAIEIVTITGPATISIVAF